MTDPIHGESEGLPSGNLSLTAKMNVAKAHLRGLDMGQVQIVISDALVAEYGARRARLILSNIVFDLEGRW